MAGHPFTIAVFHSILVIMLSNWIVMDYNSIKNSINGEQIRKESLVTLFCMISLACIYLITHLLKLDFSPLISCFSSVGIYLVYNKFQPNEFGFWQRNKVRIVYIGVVFVIASIGVYFSIPAIYFPLLMTLTIFHQHHKNFKSVSIDNAQNLDALRKQAIHFQSEIKNNKLILFSQNQAQRTQSPELYEIAG